MASIVEKTVDGYGPYLYKVTYNASTGKQHWEFLGKAGSVDEDPGPVADDYQPDTARSVNGVTRSRVDDPAAAALLDRLGDEGTAGTYEDLVDALAVEGSKAYDSGDMRSLLNLMDTDDEELTDAIDTIQTERRSNSFGTTTRTSEYIPADEDEVREALDTIEAKIGVRPGEIDEDDEYSVTLTNTDIRMPTDADAAADLVNGVVGSVTDSWRVAEPDQQASVQAVLEDTVGVDAVREAKRNAGDPDALGFAHPDTIPTNANDEGKTPVTDLYGIGPATARENHPNGDEIALEDYGELSSLQRERVAVDVDIREHPDEFRDVVDRVSDRASDPTTTIIGALQMTDSQIEDLYASDQGDTVSVGATGEDWGGISQDEMSRVESVEHREDEVHVETASGGESRYSSMYWELLDPVLPEDAVMRSGDDDTHPLEIELGNGDSVVLAPKVE
ncbi:hypothetical protein C478_07437 [Natrinema thermotolerans DSM 11552]|nr:hypothetical protein C478_07437 [Natrinema thermotolerans DSM 11552]